MINYYELLEVNEKASKEIISKVFKMHIKKNHPDLFQGDEKTKAEEKIKQINEAYETLSDDTKRRKYDEILNEENNNIVNELEQEIIILKEELEKKQELIENIGKELGITSEEYEEEKQYYNQNFGLRKDEYIEPQIELKNKRISTVREFFLKACSIIVAIILLWLGLWKITGINIMESFAENVFLK